MDSRPNQTSPPTQLDIGTKLAYERTFVALERTQLAWVRTALSFISFGFSIAKFFEFLREKRAGYEPPFSSEAIGLLMIAIGLIFLGLADLQHRRAIKQLRQRCPDLPRSLSGPMGALLACLGILAFMAAILRQ